MRDDDAVSRRAFLLLAAGAIPAARALTRRAALALDSLDSAAAQTPVVFPKGKRSVRFPFSILANAVFVPVTVRSHGPLCFALDTGSFNSIVASEIVARLGVKTKGSMSGTGSGTTFTMADIPRLDMLLPGGLVLSTTDGAAIPMAGASALIARNFDGIVGADVLRHMVVEIDYERRSLTLHDPRSYEYTGHGTALPFTYWMNYDPLIEGQLAIPGRAPIPVKIILDTGAGGTVLTTPFVAKQRLLTSVATLPSPDMGAGGGESVKHLARLGALRIGPYSISHPLAALSDDTVGTFTHSDFDVNLGGNILRRFTVIIDYPRQRVIVEPNKTFADPFLADASGLVLKAEGKDHKTFVVTGMVPHSPAADAGMKPGDVITSLDGASVRKFALWEFEDALKAAGQRHTLTVRRGQSSSNVSLDLRALI